MKFISMKSFLSLVLFLLVLKSSFSQTLIQDSVLYSSEDLKVDVDFFFNMLHRFHPNPYEYSSLDEFESSKKEIYTEIKQPMSRDDFLWVISKINRYLDTHSSFSLALSYETVNWFQRVKDNELKLFPQISFKEDKLYTKIKNKEEEIIEINGIRVDTILNYLQSYFNWQLAENFNSFIIEGYFAIWLNTRFNILAPYHVKYKKGVKEMILEGVSLEEFMDFSCYGIGRPPTIKYAIYPNSSIGIFTTHSFSKEIHDELDKKIEEFIDSLNYYNIQYVFLDLSKNGEGRKYYKLLDVVPHDTLYMCYSSTVKREGINKKENLREIVSLPNWERHNNKRQLFILQGTLTASGADYFARIISINQLGTLAGKDTGEPTSAFSSSFSYTLPCTKHHFPIATEFVDFSDFFDTKTLSPDIYWEVDYVIDFSETEILKIIETSKVNKQQNY